MPHSFPGPAGGRGDRRKVQVRTASKKNKKFRGKIMTKSKENKSPLQSLAGGLLMTILLVVVVPVLVSYFIAGIVTDLIGDTSFAGLTSGAIGAIVMFVILILFMLLLGGGAILRKYGVIGIAGLILAYVALAIVLEDDSYWFGWVIPVIIVAILGAVSYLREKKKSK
jgi:peptidoglycan/LPS O-acetylase OafA/YrhL